MTHPDRLRIALLGAGTMGSLHARAIAQSQESDLACVIDPDRRQGETLAEHFRTRWAPELADTAEIDAVVIATPTETHLDHGRRCLEAGLATLVEKPIAEDLDDTRALVDAARRHGAPLTCGLLERFNPAVRTALGIVDEPVHVTTVRHSPYAARITTGVAHDLLIHDVDLVLRLATTLPDTVSASFAYSHPKSEPDAEDIAEVTLAFPGSLIANLSVSRVSQRKVRTLVIAELERLVEVDMVRNDVTVYRHVGNAALDDGPGYRQQTIIDIPTIRDAREPLVAQLENFVALARGEADAEAELDTLVGPHALVDEIVREARTARPGS
jgi:predicted dehydrogenase